MKAIRVCRLLVALALSVLAGQPSLPAQNAPTESEIARAVRDLGDARYRVREQASEFLWKAGAAAEAALENALRSPDAEVVRRASRILDRFRWGIYPDSPAEVVAFIEQYRSGDARLRELAIEGLLRRGVAGYQALLKIASAEKDRSAREWFWRRIAEEIPQVLPSTIQEGQLGLAQQMIELSAQEGNDPQAIRSFAAFALLTGKLPDKIAEYRARSERKPDRLADQLLVYLYRAAGDLDAALAAAKRLQDQDLVELLLFERGDWKELAQRNDQRALISSDIETLGFRAAYHRLSGNPAQFQNALDDIRKAAAAASSADGDRWLFAEALLVNGQVNEAIELLKKSKNAQRAFSLLTAQGRYREALELAAQTPSSLPLRAAQAEVLYQLGEKDRALAILQELGKELAKTSDNRQAARYEVLLETERKLKLHDLKRQHAAVVLRLPQKENNLSWLFHCLYPEAGARAYAWWDFLKLRYPEESPERLVSLLDRLVGPEPDASLVAALAPELEASIRDRRAESRAEILLHLADTCFACKDDTRGAAYLRQAVAVHPIAFHLQRLADWHAGRKEWSEAARWYQQARDKDPNNVALLYLHGWALAQAGEKQQGQHLMNLASLAPLADDDSRYLLVEALRSRGLSEAVRQQRQIYLRIGDFGSWHIDEAVRHNAHEALARKDRLAAALGYERFFLSCLRPSISMVDVRSYVIVLRFIHTQRALAYLQADKPDEALQEARQALDIAPGTIDGIVDLVPGLDRLGRRTEADQLFHTALRFQEEICSQFPQSATHHNSAAWLCAVCRRQLSAGLAHAEQATRLGPDNPSYLDTLAEIYFQLGRTEEALSLIRKCITLAPHRRYYRDQLKRMEAGNPAVPVPEEDYDD